MTPNEAIRRIIEHNRIHSKKEPQAILITEALDMAVEALEKQIPKKSIVTKHQYILKSSGEIKGYKLTHCPYCWEDKKVGYFDSLVDKNVKYCRRCGQKLDWSDIE